MKHTHNANRHLIIAILVGMAGLGLLTTPGQAQNQPSAKVTAQVGFINVINEMSVSTNLSTFTTGAWVTILRNTLKTPSQKDVLIGACLEVGLLTDTLARSKNATSDTSLASAAVEVQVLVDGVQALPGPVVFGRRSQTLTATFQGIIDGCLALDTNTMSIVLDPACVTPESLGLVLETMNANAFNFIMPNLSAGVHTIAVQARINLGAGAQAGSAKARALIGHGSLTAESVRMIRNEDIELP